MNFGDQSWLSIAAETIRSLQTHSAWGSHGACGRTFVTRVYRFAWPSRWSAPNSVCDHREHHAKPNTCHEVTAARAGRPSGRTLDTSHMPTVDIIIPAYNAAHYLPTALDSVIAQTFQDWRILLVDDGSTDNTAEVVAPYARAARPQVEVHPPAQRWPPPRPQHRYPQRLRRVPRACSTPTTSGSPQDLKTHSAPSPDTPRSASPTASSPGSIQQGNITGTFAGNPEPKEGRIAPAIFMRKVDLPCPTMTFRRRCGRRGRRLRRRPCAPPKTATYGSALPSATR